VRIAALAAAALALSAAPAAADTLEGEWLAADGAARASISACPEQPGLFCGVVALLAPARAKGVALLTNLKVWGFRQAAPGHWTGGRLHDPAAGVTYDIRLSANPDGTLSVRGCLKLFCQTRTWKRA
jgi:uncharacterized protein (DUF2147 family)